jgi:hypothetical protein
MFAVSQQINFGPIFQNSTPDGEHFKKMYCMKVVTNNRNNIYISKTKTELIEKEGVGKGQLEPAKRLARKLEGKLDKFLMLTFAYHRSCFFTLRIPLSYGIMGYLLPLVSPLSDALQIQQI